MKNFILLFLFCFLFVGITYAGLNKDQKYESPDSKYVAHIVALHKDSHSSDESKIILETKKGKVICSKNYSSETGEHGFRVENASWTPDSRFFVYSMSSSGGHQAWHSPTYFISMQDFKVRRLDDYLGEITYPHFELIAPDIIKTVGRDGNLEEKTFTTSISGLLKSKQ